MDRMPLGLDELVEHWTVMEDDQTLIAGRERGPLFLSEHQPGPHRLATTDPRDISPDTGRARLGYDRARILLARYADGLRLHQLRHSPATHLGEANVSASVIMAKTGHKSLRSVQRYVKPGLAAGHRNAIEPPPARLTRGHTEYRRKPSSPSAANARNAGAARNLKLPNRAGACSRPAH